MNKSTKKESAAVLQEKIKQLILKKRLKSGDLMPTENELIEQLGVSRSSLREAIKSLEALHILDIRHGVGTFVSAPSLAPMIKSLGFHAQLNLHNDCAQLRHIVDIREVLEYGFAPLALTKITEEDVVVLRKLLNSMEKNALAQKFSAKDEYQLHLQMYAPLNNPLLLQYLDAFWQIYQQVEKQLPPLSRSAQQWAMLHRELVDGIEARDLTRVNQAILCYFQTLRARLALFQAQ